jgi:hypothetical protein
MSGLGRIWLLGLMRGHWDATDDVINDMAAQTKGDQLNLGIAVVVPAYQIEETLMHPDCKAERQGDTTSRC